MTAFKASISIFFWQFSFHEHLLVFMILILTNFPRLTSTLHSDSESHPTVLISYVWCTTLPSSSDPMSLAYASITDNRIMPEDIIRKNRQHHPKSVITQQESPQSKPWILGQAQFVLPDRQSSRISTASLSKLLLHMG